MKFSSKLDVTRMTGDDLTLSRIAKTRDKHSIKEGRGWNRYANGVERGALLLNISSKQGYVTATHGHWEVESRHRYPN